jgi:hypothetical protein
MDELLQADRPLQGSAAVAQPASSEPRVCGALRRGRTGLLRSIEIVTGLALLRWLVKGIAALLGYSHTATLILNATNLELQGERRFMGISLGSTRRIIPLPEVRCISQVAESPLWALAAALLVIVLSVGIGTVLIVWGCSGRQLSWSLLGASVIGAGVLLDALAHLWIRRQLSRGRATLEVETGRDRFRLSHATEESAVRLLDQARSRLFPH